MKNYLVATSMMLTVVSLAACGDTRGDRALTSEDQIDLGKPVWK